jgi:hypothetical protein
MREENTAYSSTICSRSNANALHRPASAEVGVRLQTIAPSLDPLQTFSLTGAASLPTFKGTGFQFVEHVEPMGARNLSLIPWRSAAQLATEPRPARVSGVRMDEDTLDARTRSRALKIVAHLSSRSPRRSNHGIVVWHQVVSRGPGVRGPVAGSWNLSARLVGWHGS